MGKTANSIKMLQILNSGRVYKVSELAELLETNPRNIIEYKKELEECGYIINSISGKYGGYYLDKSILIPTTALSEKEQSIYNEGLNYLLSRDDFLTKKEYINAASKISSTILKNVFNKELTVVSRFPLAISEEQLKKKYDIINISILSKCVIKMKYLSLKNVVKEHYLHPYDLFVYNNAWFVIDWCETYNDILYFKVNRIQEVEVTERAFIQYKYYDISNYIDEFGFKNNGDWHHVEFIATGPYASLVKERIYGKNQEVIALDDTKTLVKVDMQNKENIRVFILGFGCSCQVLQPKWLMEDLLNISTELKLHYSEILESADNI